MADSYPVQSHPNETSSTNIQAESSTQENHGTTTITEEQTQNKLQTLILKLKQKISSNINEFLSNISIIGSKDSKLSYQELEQSVKTYIDDFRHALVKNIVDFQHLVLSTKPDPEQQKKDPEAYRTNMENHKILLQLATGIARQMQGSFNDIFVQCEKHIENIWTAISKKKDTGPIQLQFGEALRENMNQFWKPVFDQFDRLLQNNNPMTNPPMNND